MTVDGGAEELTLADLSRCYEGGVPAVMCTADADGVPNITYMSRVHQVDAERIAVSNQFMSKTSRNIAVNPAGDVLLIDPVSYEEYRLSTRYERTERRGPVFERLRDDVEELAELMGLQGVFRLRAADIHRVVAIERVGRAYPDLERATPPVRTLDALLELTGRVERVTDLEALVEVAIAGIDSVLGYRHASMLLLDESGSTLFTIASRGFVAQNVGAEVALGEGPVGGPLARCEVVRSTGLRQMSKYSRTIRTSFDAYGVGPGVAVPIPTLSDANSRIVVPMRALGQLVGGIVVESPEIGAFTVEDEQVLALAAGVLGGAIEHARLLEAAESQAVVHVEDTSPEAVPSIVAHVEETSAEAVPPGVAREQARSIRFFAADGSVFIDGEYVIKGVAGRILRSLVAEHLDSGRTAFTNRELRLDRSLDLPGFKDNLESRLLLLTRRLDERDAPLRLGKAGRGRFTLEVRSPLALEVVAAETG